MENNCSFCGQPVCEDPSRCDFAAEHEAALVASATSMISIPKTEHERLFAAAERCERLEAAIRTAIEFMAVGRSTAAIEGVLLDAMEGKS